jgi:hypothetical protein
LPGFARFAWMFFMQPVSLHHLLKASGIEEPNAPGWKLWFRPGPDREIRRSYVRRLMDLLLAMPPIAFGLSLCLDYSGVDINYAGVAAGVTGGLGFGVAVGVAEGVAGGVAVGVVIGVVGGAFGVAEYAVPGGAGVALGVTRGVPESVGKGMELSSLRSQTWLAR